MVRCLLQACAGCAVREAGREVAMSTSFLWTLTQIVAVAVFSILCSGIVVAVMEFTFVGWVKKAIREEREERESGKP
jgi:hypothetical protein